MRRTREREVDMDQHRRFSWEEAERAERPENTTTRRLYAVISEPRPEIRTAWKTLGTTTNPGNENFTEYYFGGILFLRVSQCFGSLNTGDSGKRLRSCTHCLWAFSVHILRVGFCFLFVFFLTVYTQGHGTLHNPLRY